MLARILGSAAGGGFPQWNRYDYRTRTPIKDALILSKFEDVGFRRTWIRRIHDHDGSDEGIGGLALRLKLAEGVGLDPEEVAGYREVLPGVHHRPPLDAHGPGTVT